MCYYIIWLDGHGKYLNDPIKEFLNTVVYLICVRDYNNSDLTIRDVYHRYVQPRGITEFLDGHDINQDIIINNRLRMKAALWII